MLKRVRRAWARYFAVVGRRGTFLILMGFAWLVIGYGVSKDPVMHSPALPHETLPAWLRVGGWVVGGVAGIVCAFTKRVTRDIPGFVLMCIPAATRAVSYFMSWIMFQYEGPDGGLGTAWSGAVVWFTVVFMLMLVASWPEPHFTAKRGN